MTLHTLSVPDDPAELPRWLERRLTAPDFGRFLAELTAHFPHTPPGPPLDRILPSVLADGLGAVPPETLGQLLRNPAALAELQERIVTDGGAYWDAVLDGSDELTDAVERGRQGLDRVLATVSPPTRTDAPPTVPSERAKPSAGRGYKLWAFASTGIAACLAVAVGVLAVRGPDGPGEPAVPKAQLAWGWAKPGGLAIDESNPKAYLTRLAANAEEWSQHRPSDPAGVGTRIAEFRIGCTRLMHSSYGPLAPADKTWLLDHCRAWAKRLDAHQQALDAGADPAAVRAAVDETVREIAATLREKAGQVG